MLTSDTIVFPILWLVAIINFRHINGPRHSLTQDGAQEIQQLQVQAQHSQQQAQPQAQVIYQQPQQHPHHQAIVHQVHQVHQRGGVEQVHVQSTTQHPHRTYTLYNEQGEEYTDIQAVSSLSHYRVVIDCFTVILWFLWQICYYYPCWYLITLSICFQLADAAEGLLAAEQIVIATS